MQEYDIVYKDIRLRLVCEETIMRDVINYFYNRVIIEDPRGIPTYQVVVNDNAVVKDCLYYRKVDKWFDYASLDFYINNNDQICYIKNIDVCEKHRDKLICTSIANVFNRLLELKGYLGIHASCVEKQNEGVLFVAERNSGKTVSALNLMSDGYNIVGNDMIAFRKENDNIIGYGVPQTASLRLSKSFCDQEVNKKYLLFAKEKNIDIDKCISEGKSINLSETELANINAVSQTIDTPIKCIIRPNYDPGIEHLTFYEMPIEQTRDLVYSQYKSLVHETSDFLINIKIKDVDESLRYKYLEDMAKIPAYYCIQNEKTTDEFIRKVDSVRKRVR